MPRDDEAEKSWLAMTSKKRYLSLMESVQKTSDYILELADRCVKCGLCLPQCPTYELAINENESPRGRIALVQGWLTGNLSLSPTLTQHLDQCLLCRRCERVCPSQVAYAEIIDQSKILISQQKNNAFSLQKIIINNGLRLLLNKKISNVFIPVLRLFQQVGGFTLTKKTGLLKLIGMQRITSYLPKLEKPIKTKSFYPATKPNLKNENVALFTGCLSKQLDPKTVSASIKILNHLGFGVYVPEQQVCCGALDLHEGKKEYAASLAAINIKTFNQQHNISAIVSLVNGCTSQLREYSQLQTKGAFIPEVKDIIEFLAEIEWPENIEFTPLNKAVALQIPCSLQNILRAEGKLLTLLQRIPGMTLPPEAIHNRCCGAAGTYFLHFPEISDELQQSAIEKLKQTSPKLIISSNIGCALHLKAGLSKDNKDIQVIHPVLLLEKQLKSN